VIGAERALYANVCSLLLWGRQKGKGVHSVQLCEETKTQIATELSKILIGYQKNKAGGPHGFTGEFYLTPKEEVMPILLELLRKKGGATTQLVTATAKR
jgi:hypothetical protein